MQQHSLSTAGGSPSTRLRAGLRLPAPALGALLGDDLQPGMSVCGFSFSKDCEHEVILLQTGSAPASETFRGAAELAGAGGARGHRALPGERRGAEADKGGHPLRGRRFFCWCTRGSWQGSAPSVLVLRSRCRQRGRARGLSHGERRARNATLHPAFPDPRGRAPRSLLKPLTTPFRTGRVLVPASPVPAHLSGGRAVPHRSGEGDGGGRCGGEIPVPPPPPPPRAALSARRRR